MRDVYQGAVVTLAAACASNTHEGILRERQNSTIPKCWLDWRVDDATTARVFLRSGSELWDENFHQSILNTRGWTLQETLLAPRTLWFGQQQFGFECAEGSVSEAGRNIRTAEMYRSKGYIQKLRGQPIPLWRQRLLTLLRDLNTPLPYLSLYLHYLQFPMFLRGRCNVRSVIYSLGNRLPFKARSIIQGTSWGYPILTFGSRSSKTTLPATFLSQQMLFLHCPDSPVSFIKLRVTRTLPASGNRTS